MRTYALSFLVLVCSRLLLSVSSADVTTTNELVRKSSDLDGNYFVSTLDGQLHCLSKDGQIRWSFQDNAVIQMPHSTLEELTLVPSPYDGSLYGFLKQGDIKLRKIPFTIKELILLSPSRSSEGYLYTGSKKDTWLVVDAENGEIVQRLTAFEHEQLSSDKSESLIYIARSEYSLSIIDSKDRDKRWQVVYMDYTNEKLPPADMTASAPNETFIVSSASSRLIASDRNGEIMWQSNFASPVIGVYTWNQNTLRKAKQMVFADETINLLTMFKNVLRPITKWLEHLENNVVHSLYMIDSLITLPALIDRSSFASKVRELPSNLGTASIDDGSSNLPSVVAKGNYFIHPDELNFNHPLLPAPREAPPVIRLPHDTNDATGDSKVFDGHYRLSWYGTTLLSLIISTVLIYLTRRRSVAKYSRIGDAIQIGSIRYNVNEILGRGCDGTIVYRGNFDNRQVAVKRVLPECFDFAQREVDLLRLSDQHEHVIRYFATETHNEFQYIALELCVATLADFIEGRVNFKDVVADNLTLFRQAIAGLSHLHSLDVIHRDVKPQNVLLTLNAHGLLKALISDFGFCKRIQSSRKALTKRNGFTGTEGWISPEAMTDAQLTTKADVFSAGLLLFYVRTGGKHPFGIEEKRQYNIGRNKFDLFELVNQNDCLTSDLVKWMITMSVKKRPNCESVLRHPLFWSNNRKLNFLQDVSDRIDKETESSDIVIAIEKDKRCIRYNWRANIDEEFYASLRSHRGYNIKNVRDLLRAIRNKRNHYGELSDTLKQLLGEIPDGYLAYFDKRFPALLLHVYACVAQSGDLKKEAVFSQYFNSRE